MERRPGRRGFTLAELMFAIAIFSMVMAGLGAIYITSLRQSMAISGEARLKSMAVLAMHAIRGEVSMATRIDTPAEGGSTDVLVGGRNVASDGTYPMSGFAADTRWFAFCVRYAAIGACGSSRLDPTPCLFYYSGAGWPPPAVTAANCGTSLGGVAPMILASGVAPAANGVHPSPTWPPGTWTYPFPWPSGAPGNFFTRDITTKAANWNQVRVFFMIAREPTPSSQEMTYVSDSSYNGHFSKYP